MTRIGNHPQTAIRLATVMSCGLIAASCTAAESVASQEPTPARSAADIVRLEAAPTALTIRAGETATIDVTAYNAAGAEVQAEYRFSGPRRGLSIEDGEVTGVAAGDYEVAVSLFPSPGVGWRGESPPRITIPVRVTWPRVTDVTIRTDPGTLYQGTVLRHHAAAFHADGSERPEPRIEWRSSAPGVAAVDRFGNVTAQGTGSVVITATVDGTEGRVTHSVRALPVQRLEIVGGSTEARTGDVLNFSARAIGENGREITDVPVSWAHSFVRADPRSAPGSGGGQVIGGKFVAEDPGEHTIIATAGPHTARAVIHVTPRDVVQRIEVLGHGRIDHTRTTDFWVFEGLDGRDYAITGSKDVGGQAYIWDVTDPTNIILTDSVKVDARSVNDVKVSPDGRYASMTREGASDRRNGVVILDLSNPAHPTVAAEHTDGLTGGVHNSFPTNDYLFALSAGEKYVIIDVRDIHDPRNVGEFRYPSARIHDVWVRDGIAYSAQQPFGSIIVDVGNGRWGGTPENPVLVNKTGPMPEGGGGHAIFPYASESTDRFYLFLGDEIMQREGRALAGTSPRGAYRVRYDPETGEGGVPLHTSGYLHIVDFTDPEKPRKVARYHVPEYGTHNLWIEDDVLYQAYYEGGLRVVDISGELMGDLQRQGREIAVFKPYDPIGYVANAPMVWNAMPHKGTIFLTDTNSGLWAVRLLPRNPGAVDDE